MFKISFNSSQIHIKERFVCSYTISEDVYVNKHELFWFEDGCYYLFIDMQCILGIFIDERVLKTLKRSQFKIMNNKESV